MANVSQSEKDAAYARGQSDRGGDYTPPKGDVLVDVFFSPITRLFDLPTTHQVAAETRSAYDSGYSKPIGK